MHKIDDTVAHMKDEDFKRLIINKMNAISEALIKLDSKMNRFQSVTLETLKNEIFTKMRSVERDLQEDIDTLNLDYKIFKAKVVGGIAVLATIIEAVKSYLL